MEEIKDGEYVRTITGLIRKVTNSDYYMAKYIECEKGILLRENITGHSPNVFNLIGEGDYVNGHKVLGFEEKYYDADFDDYINGFCYVVGNEEGMYRIPPHEIESIVTKEQFEAIKYEVIK